MHEGAEKIFRCGTSRDTWLRLNTADPDLIYKSGQARQLAKIGAITSLFNQEHLSVAIVGQHRSKSVPLPVTCIKFHPYDQVHTYCFIRDNFHDIKLCVVSDGPVKIPYHLIYAEWSEERLEEERQSYLGYPSNMTVAEQNEKRLKVAANENWYHEDWSGSKIIRKDDRIYTGARPLKVYCQGIDDLGLPEEAFEMYETDKSVFGIELYSYQQLAHVLYYVDRSLEKYRSVWLDNGGREKLKAEGRL